VTSPLFCPFCGKQGIDRAPPRIDILLCPHCHCFVRLALWFNSGHGAAFPNVIPPGSNFHYQALAVKGEEGKA
jgi:hypothetical protein